MCFLLVQLSSRHRQPSSFSSQLFSCAHSTFVMRVSYRYKECRGDKIPSAGLTCAISPTRYRSTSYCGSTGRTMSQPFLGIYGYLLLQGVMKLNFTDLEHPANP